jgi:hypothetical protein
MMYVVVATNNYDEYNAPKVWGVFHNVDEARSFLQTVDNERETFWVVQLVTYST